MVLCREVCKIFINIARAQFLPIELISLVPRPFPPPVFDRLQYANTEGEDLGDLVTCGYVR